MLFSRWNDYQKTKYLSCAYFIVVGLFNFIEGLMNQHFSALREPLLLLVLALPLWVNRRLFYLAYGLLAWLVLLIVFILYIVAFMNNPVKPENAVWYFLTGCVVFSTGLLAAMGLIFIGSYTGEKNTFRLV